MNWWRAHHGIANDPKMALVAMSHHVTPCHATRGDVLAVWVSLLDFASQNHPRGSVENADPEQIGWSLEMPVEKVSAIIQAFRDRKMIVDNLLTAWEKRQPKREREDHTANDRKRRQRAEHGHAMSRQVTPRHTMSPTEERRGEENTTTKKQSCNLKTTAATEQQPSPFRFSDFPQTARAVFLKFPTADVVLVNQIIEASARAYLSVDSPKIPEPDDFVYAVAVETAMKESKKQTSPALFMKTVPSVIANWARFGRNGNDAKPMRTYTPPVKPIESAPDAKSA